MVDLLEVKVERIVHQDAAFWLDGGDSANIVYAMRKWKWFAF